MYFRLSTLVIFAGLLMGAASNGWSVVSASDLITEMQVPGHSLVIVDVREPELYKAGHIPGAINIPYPGAKTQALDELSPDQNIVFVCHGGPMGAELAAILDTKGYKKVRNLTGGMRQWSGPLE
jgi:rhodanese-related sulfurtransferase